MGSEEVFNSDGTQGTYWSFFRNAVSTTFVVPATNSSHPEVLNPSHLDHLHMDRYVPILFFYRLADNKDVTYKSYVDQLKSSLSQTLVPFYPMAGRVLKTTNPDHPREILLNDQGVPFSEAFLDLEMDAVLEPQQPIGYLSGLEPAGLDTFKQIQQYPEEGNPASVVQVTRFRCGGVAVAISWNHLVGDMTAAMQFLTAWSDISRTGTTFIKPDHDRSMFIEDRLPLEPSVNPSGFTATETARIEKVLQTKYSRRILLIRKEAIDKVKQEALQDMPGLSTMDCLCAHLWRSLAKVYAASGLSDTTIFTTAVEGRKQMQVSPFYFGNVVTTASVRGVAATEILSKPLSYAASLIREAIRGITKDTYWDIINEMDLRNPWKTSINRTDYQLGLTSWIRFGLYDMDFGRGKPISVSLNLLAQNSRKGQTVVLPSSLGDGNFCVALNLPPAILEDLWADSEFTSLS